MHRRPRPGGTLAALTLRSAPDPVHRHFPTAIDERLGIRSHHPDALAAALAEAGTTLRCLAEPRTFLILTATRTTPPRTAYPTAGPTGRDNQ
ncbi:hypothetical protein ACFVT2_18665 [Streptomyces sp. NPDC058000]|uniref:hypothetical protein n=1 Tax=Streptomyces sp. NPDC058000 TaxID=3346299 RepID=UPI0036E23D55